MKNNERAKHTRSDPLYSGFKTLEKEEFYDVIIVKLLAVL